MLSNNMTEFRGDMYYIGMTLLLLKGSEALHCVRGELVIQHEMVEVESICELPKSSMW